MPCRRTYIPKADGKQRPLGIAAIEDKIVQAAVAMILTPIYEAEFLGLSYGFRPGSALAYRIKPQRYRFKDDGLIPNHPKWPLIIYKGVVRLPENLDPAAVFEDLCETNGWGDSWRDGIYDYAHYHSRIHEVLGIARGSARVQFGGPKGRTLVLKAGDVAILPAGTGHQCLNASDDFLVAYPPSGTFDICKKPADRKEALVTIPKVAHPRKDPVFGAKGPLMRTWRKPVQRKTVAVSS